MWWKLLIWFCSKSLPALRSTGALEKVLWRSLVLPLKMPHFFQLSHPATTEVLFHTTAVCADIQVFIPSFQSSLPTHTTRSPCSRRIQRINQTYPRKRSLGLVNKLVQCLSDVWHIATKVNNQLHSRWSTTWNWKKIYKTASKHRWSIQPGIALEMVQPLQQAVMFAQYWLRRKKYFHMQFLLQHFDFIRLSCQVLTWIETT